MRSKANSVTLMNVYMLIFISLKSVIHYRDGDSKLYINRNCILISIIHVICLFLYKQVFRLQKIYL
jgi:hypothetical protein